MSLESILPDPAERNSVAGRATVARRLQPLPIEAVVRGYLIGSGWKDYQRDRGSLRHPPARRPAPGRAAAGAAFYAGHQGGTGDHDENISFEQTVAADRPGSGLAGPRPGHTDSTAAERNTRPARHHHRRHQVRVRPGRRRQAVPHRRSLTPDSSRFWPTSRLSHRHQPTQLRQAVRARLPRNPGLEQARTRPETPRRGDPRTSEKYQQALELLTRG